MPITRRKFIRGGAAIAGSALLANAALPPNSRAVATAVEITDPLLNWDELVPGSKREALHAYSAEKGHPPRGH